MNDEIHLQAVVDGPAEYENLPWAYTVLPAPWFFRLWENSTGLEVGTFLAQLVLYNSLEHDGTFASIATSISEDSADNSLVLPGGVRVASHDGVAQIDPGCCSGLEDIRDWQAIPAGGYAPWWGHNPSPWLERTSSGYRLWCDNIADEGAQSISVTEAHFHEALVQLDLDLRNFFVVLTAWAVQHFAEYAGPLVAAIDSSFRLTGRQGPPSPESAT